MWIVKQRIRSNNWLVGYINNIKYNKKKKTLKRAKILYVDLPKKFLKKKVLA